MSINQRMPVIFGFYKHPHLTIQCELHCQTEPARLTFVTGIQNFAGAIIARAVKDRLRSMIVICESAGVPLVFPYGWCCSFIQKSVPTKMFCENNSVVHLSKAIFFTHGLLHLSAYAIDANVLVQCHKPRESNYEVRKASHYRVSLPDYFCLWIRRCTRRSRTGSQ